MCLDQSKMPDVSDVMAAPIADWPTAAGATR